MKQFSVYAFVGLANTAIHWSSFFILLWMTGHQSIANLVGFLLAATFSFYVNCHWTFGSTPTGKRYLLMVSFLGILSFVMGIIADNLKLLPIITLIAFSAISLMVGFLFSKWVVFKD